MKKTILCYIIFSVLGSCAITNVMATPGITEVRGGWGIYTSFTECWDCDWKIEIKGQHIFRGGMMEGTFSNWDNNARRRTPIFHPWLGWGKINITVSLNWGYEDIEKRTAFMYGPFVFING